MGMMKHFPNCLADNISDPAGSFVMNFGKRLQAYADVFGRENLRLVSYSNLSDDNIDLAGHFFDTFLPSHRSLIEGIPDLGRPNKSFPPLNVEVIRALNSSETANGVLPPSTALRGWYLENAKRFDLAPLFSAIEANTATLPFSDASRGAQLLHDLLFATYGDLMVQPAEPGRLFTPREKDIVYFKQKYLMDDVARKTLDAIYLAFRNESGSFSGNAGFNAS